MRTARKRLIRGVMSEALPEDDCRVARRETTENPSVFARGLPGHSPTNKIRLGGLLPLPAPRKQSDHT